MIRMDALRALVAVAAHGNIKDAADQLHRTTSALSMTLKQIETRLGGPLFEADRKQTLTELGKLVHDTGVILLRDYDRAMETIAAHAGAFSGRLRLASVPSVAVMLLPQALQEFLRLRPDVDVELVDTDSTDVWHMVETGQVDMGFASAPGPERQLQFDALFREPFRLICHSASAIAAASQPIEWRDLGEANLTMNEALRALPDQQFRQLAQRSQLSVRNVSSLVAMVAADMGVTLLPNLATLNLPPEIKCLTLADTNCCRTVGVIQRHDKVISPLVKAFHNVFIQTTARQANVELLQASPGRRPDRA